jgi:ADP-ribosylglycohydrolase
MIGAIAGDIIGSRFEFKNHRSRDFELFAGLASSYTDDTILTVATARWLLDGGRWSRRTIIFNVPPCRNPQCGKEVGVFLNIQLF